MHVMGGYSKRLVLLLLALTIFLLILLTCFKTGIYSRGKLTRYPQATVGFQDQGDSNDNSDSLKAASTPGNATPASDHIPQLYRTDLNNQKYDLVNILSINKLENSTWQFRHNSANIRNSTGKDQGQIIDLDLNQSDASVEANKSFSRQPNYSFGEVTSHYVVSSQHMTTGQTYMSLIDMVRHVTNPGYPFSNYSQNVDEEDIETFRAHVPPLLEHYRTPCWLERLVSSHVYNHSYYLLRDCMEKDAVLKSFRWSHSQYLKRIQEHEFWRMRCLPAFYLLGMPKSGTTDMYVTMVRNLKHVISGARKEPHFWNRRRFGVTYSGSCRNSPDSGRAGLKDYLDLHDEAAEKTKLRFLLKNRVYHHKVLIGDFTPSTMWSLPSWWRIHGNKDQSEPRHTTADHIHGLWPHSKLIVMLRDPVQRAYSQMKYRSLPTNGQVAEHFHQLVTSTIHELQKCRPLRACIYNRTDPESPNMDGNFIVIPGLYDIFVADWLKVFPRDQFLFIRFEDYVVDKGQALKRVAEFLEIEPLSANQNIKIKYEKPANSGIVTEPMWNSTRRLLQNFYRPWNNRLAQTLADDGFNWPY